MSSLQNPPHHAREPAGSNLTPHRELDTGILVALLWNVGPCLNRAWVMWLQERLAGHICGHPRRPEVPDYRFRGRLHESPATWLIYVLSSTPYVLGLRDLAVGATRSCHRNTLVVVCIVVPALQPRPLSYLAAAINWAYAGPAGGLITACVALMSVYGKCLRST